MLMTKIRLAGLVSGTFAVATLAACGSETGPDLDAGIAAYRAELSVGEDLNDDQREAVEDIVRHGCEFDSDKAQWEVFVAKQIEDFDPDEDAERIEATQTARWAACPEVAQDYEDTVNLFLAFLE